MSSVWQSDDWREVRLLKIQDHHNFTFYGQSIAGTRTCIVIDELKVVFDLGFFPRKAAACDIILITHGHADHMGALHLHAFDRRMNHLDDPTYVMPKACVDHFNRAYQALKQLNRHHDGELSTTYKIIGADPPDGRQDEGECGSTCESAISEGESAISEGESATSESLGQGHGQTILNLPKSGGIYHVNAYSMIHSVPAVGYVIFETRKKLRSDLRAKILSGELVQSDISRLVKSGEVVSEITEVPLIAFTGDTTIGGLLRHPDMLNSETLIIECTYLLANLDESKHDTPEECHRRGHIHEQDIVDNQARFQCKELILCHFSRKYRREDIFDAKDRLQKIFADRVLITVFQD